MQGGGCLGAVLREAHADLRNKREGRRCSEACNDIRGTPSQRKPRLRMDISARTSEPIQWPIHRVTSDVPHQLRPGTGR